MSEENLTSQQTIDLFEKFVIPNYRRYPISLVRGEGSHVWDAEGKKYLDLFPGWGCNILGYSPSKVVQAIQNQVNQLIHVPNTWYTQQQGEFAEKLVRHSFGQAFFCNSGAEANEAAIKLARLHNEGERYKIITFENSFHGRTLGTLTATGQAKCHQGLGPLVAGFSYAPFNDLQAVDDLIDEKTAAIMVEPVQGEGGVNVPHAEFLPGLRKLATERDLLLIFDEVQTGIGRTGEWFGYQNFDVQPDVITLAKGLAGGVACGAMIAKKEIAAGLKPGTHASTFGGNSLAMSAGIATIKTIEEENLLENCREISAFIQEYFQNLKEQCPAIKDIRVKGLMVGIELSYPADKVVAACMERSVLVNATQEFVLRMLPAINISKEDIKHGCQVVGEVLQNLQQER